jgi:hypothetical protein
MDREMNQRACFAFPALLCVRFDHGIATIEEGEATDRGKHGRSEVLLRGCNEKQVL